MCSPPTSGSEGAGARAPDFRFGYVAFVGRPNAGKSTLFNTLLGQRLSIVTARPQTTRGRILGILTRPASQVVLLDTPGLLEARYRLHETMEAQIQRACADADAVVLLLDGTRPDDRGRLVDLFLRRNRKPVVPVLNKVDRIEPERLEPLLARLTADHGLPSLLPVSALTGANVAFLLSLVEDLLPPGPAMYPADRIAEQPERFFAAELIRETAFEQLADELPYSIQVQVDEFREPRTAEPRRKTYLLATFFVERDSQKGIVIGRKGARLRSIGTRARESIEELIDGPVFLELRVKVRPGWRKREKDLKEFGYL